MDSLIPLTQCFNCGALFELSKDKCIHCGYFYKKEIPQQFKHLNLIELFNLIQRECYLLERFLGGFRTNYEYFDFNGAFTKLFYEVNKKENYKPNNIEKIMLFKYYFETLNHQIDKGYYDNENAFENVDFEKVYDEISLLNSRDKDFFPFIPNDFSEIDTSLVSINDVLNSEQNEALPPQQIKTKVDNLKEQLSKYGFFELEKVKVLSEQSKFSLIKKISENSLPYAIAMFDYLQFIQYIEKQYFDSKYKLNKEVSKWFDSDKNGRAVKGNISSLSKNTTENKTRYTAHKHKESVVKDYEQLK